MTWKPCAAFWERRSVPTRSTSTVLKDRGATREAILKAFRLAVKRSTEVPTLFYFSGYASYKGGLLEAILSSDSRP